MAQAARPGRQLRTVWGLVCALVWEPGVCCLWSASQLAGAKWPTGADSIGPRAGLEFVFLCSNRPIVHGRGGNGAKARCAAGVEV